MDGPVNFELHERLEADTYHIGDFPLCKVLLMNDQRFPWFILVPRKGQMTELYHLTEEDRVSYIQETSFLSQKIMDAFSGHKLNVATLGNVVPQLHIHHVVRYRDDAAWPGPVWGFGEAVPYTDEVLKERLSRLSLLKGELFTPTQFLKDLLEN
ncbi:HIT domain-containing protein [Litoribrevibacter albus]|uniref:Histidine triad protein n=1 Tax=Litoribrevibacter albus TaxID=1473156 RepID=A0AA37SA24_9GAMM|nr:HIT domain-containing protein [Litoribrevibacter albus]GLQ31253.1 histidine triad protein [Litoribrevibacter albus]